MRIDDLFTIIERDGAYYLVPQRKVHLGFPTKPLGKIYIDGDTFEMFKAIGVNFECATLTWDTALGDYVLKPEKGGTGALHNITITGDGATRGVSVEPTVNAVGIGTDPDVTKAAKIGGDTEVDGQLYISPGAGVPPFILDAPSKGQLVEGLNAEMISGLTLSEVGSSSVVVDTGEQTITGTTSETTFWTTTVAGGLLASAKRLQLSLWFTGPMGATSILRIKYGGTVIFLSSASIASSGNTWIDLDMIYKSGVSQFIMARVTSEVATSAGSLVFGRGGTAAIDSSVAQTLLVTFQPSGTGISVTRHFAQLRRMS